MREPLRTILHNYGGAVLVAIVFALGIRFFILEAYKIPSQTMRPTLEAGDTIFVNKFAFGVRLPWLTKPLTTPKAPQYGDVVIFSLPTDPEVDYIKRIVALAGDTVEIKKGKVILNSAEQKHIETSTVHQANAICGPEALPNISYDICLEPPIMDDYGPEKIPPESVLVLGDLRTKSQDTRKPRSWDIVPLNLIKAKALWIWLSIEPAGLGTNAGWFSRIRFERMFKRIK